MLIKKSHCIVPSNPSHSWAFYNEVELNGGWRRNYSSIPTPQVGDALMFFSDEHQCTSYCFLDWFQKASLTETKVHPQHSVIGRDYLHSSANLDATFSLFVPAITARRAVNVQKLWAGVKAPIQKELCHTDEWEADVLKVGTTVTKLGTHSSVKESV